MEKEKKKITLKEIGIKNLVLICIAGIVLIVVSVPDFLSFSKKENKVKQNQVGQELNQTSASLGSEANEMDYVAELENRLKNMLKKVEGIGEVEVMITIESSREKVILKDSPYTQDSSNEADGQGGSRIINELSKEEETVLVQPEEGGAVPYIIKEIEPKIAGVVVIAQGGGNTKVINEINSAIEALFGVPIHKIKVMKMSDSGNTP